jgi:hypothetical protein
MDRMAQDPTANAALADLQTDLADIDRAFRRFYSLIPSLHCRENQHAEAD